MTKEVLIHQIIDVLSHAGFVVSERCNIRPRSFDIAARKDKTLLLCKVLFNIDGLNEEDVLKLEIPTGQPIIYDHVDGKLLKE